MYGLNTLGGALSLTTKSGLSHPGKVARISFGSFNRKKLMFLWGEFADGMARITFYLQVILMNLVGGIIPTEKSRISSEKPRKY